MINIYTDGSTRANGKENSNSGYAVVVLVNDDTYMDYYCAKRNISGTTNNRMELSAILRALELTQTKYKNEKCVIKSDSAYCVNMCNDWIWTWAKNNWMNSKKVQVENIDLVQQIYKYLIIEFNNFQIEKVIGHAHICGNELADAAATGDQTKFVKILKENDIDYIGEELFDLQ